MTPEERAQDIYMAYPALVDSSGDEFVAFVAAAIRAERERAARVLDDAASAYAARWEANDTGAQYIKLLKRHAAAIREG